jgi:hypothetical protein
LAAKRPKTFAAFARTFVIYAALNVLNIKQNIAKSVQKYVNSVQKHAGLWLNYLKRMQVIFYLHSLFHFIKIKNYEKQ